MSDERLTQQQAQDLVVRHQQYQYQAEAIAQQVNMLKITIRDVETALTTITALKDEPAGEEIGRIYHNFYKDKPFIRLIRGIPVLGSVRGSNFCDIGFEIEKDSRRIVIISALDNLVKGASGQAIQNMNLMLGLPETKGLWTPGIAP